MKIIKEKDMTHEIFCDKEITYNTLEIYRFEEPDGYLYINKGKEEFSIYIHSSSELLISEKLKEILLPYLNGKTTVTVNDINTSLIDFIKSKGQEYWWGSYMMHLDGKIEQMSKGELQPYKGEFEIYIDIFGRCFEPMRQRHDFKPYNWYKSNKDVSIKEFEDANKKGDFYGYVVDGQIVGGGIVKNNEIDILAIKPELQCTGLGRQLLRGIVNEMKKSKHKIDISVVESNQHVLKFYMSEGFIIDKLEKIFKNY
ncbi:MAG: GNAT family N-acetyltransferase [Candidatus Delongbacteria bacterium]|nr:GNAT family N-acetyltransferase [Candidatus Delongbacteria bacterium]